MIGKNGTRINHPTKPFEKEIATSHQNIILKFSLDAGKEMSSIGSIAKVAVS